MLVFASKEQVKGFRRGGGGILQIISQAIKGPVSHRARFLVKVSENFFLVQSSWIERFLYHKHEAC